MLVVAEAAGYVQDSMYVRTAQDCRHKRYQTACTYSIRHLQYAADVNPAVGYPVARLLVIGDNQSPAAQTAAKLDGLLLVMMLETPPHLISKTAARWRTAESLAPGAHLCIV